MMERGATLSDCRLYRYDLWRTWAPDRIVNSPGARLCWVMLNPSTADGEQDDPTIRRCIDFSKRWGYGGIVVVNLFALRVTRPVHLNHRPEPVGPRNDEIAGLWIRHLPVVAAWGAHRKAREREAWFFDQARVHHQVRCLGLTKRGHPKHPLFVRADQEPILLPVVRAAS